MSNLPVTDISLLIYNQKFSINSKIFINSALVDTGSQRTLIRKSLLDQHNINLKKLNTFMQLTNAINSKSDNFIKNYVHCDLIFNQSAITMNKIDILVIDGPLSYPCIIGIDVLRNIKIDFRKPYIFSNNLQLISKPDLEIVELNAFEEPQSDEISIIASEELILYPGTEKSISINFDVNKKSVNSINLIGSTKQLSINKISMPILISNKGFLKLTNFNENTVVIPPGCILAHIKELKDEEKDIFKNFDKIDKLKIDVNNLITYNELSDREKQVHDQECLEWRERRNTLVLKNNLKNEIELMIKNVPITLKPVYRKILTENNFCFSRAEHDAGLSKHYLIDIVLKVPNCEPHYSTPYKLDSEIASKLEIKINEMIKSGILERSSSAWNSPVLGIKKKNNQIRLVNNFKTGVNQMLHKSSFPIVAVRHLFHQIGEFITKQKTKFPTEKIIFSQFDCKNGFYSLALREKSRDITAFVISNLQVRYCRLSQGLSISPSDFSRYMHHIFLGVDTEKLNFRIFLFVDDLIVISAEKHHTEAVNQFLKITVENCCILNLSKSKFHVEKVEFLGYNINENGIFASPARVETLLELPTPLNHKSAMRVMGIFNYFSREIPRLSALMSPMAKQIGLKEKYECTEEVKNGLNKVKELIKAGIATHHLSFESSNKNVVFIATDASLYACGFCLGNATLQNDQLTNVKFCHFGSKIFDKQVSLMSSRGRELIGLSTALTTFSDLIPPGLEFLAIVDHKSLINVETSKNLGKTSVNTRTRSAFANVLNYPNMKIKHFPGKSWLISLCDGISRSYFPVNLLPKSTLDPTIDIKNTTLIESNHLKINAPKISRASIIKEQALDKEISEIIHKMEQKTLHKMIIKEKIYCFQNNLLHLVSKAGDLLIIIPETIANDLIHYLHEMSLHQGREKLKNAVYDAKIFIKNKLKIIDETVRHCLYCQLTNPNRYDKTDKIEYKIRPAFAPFEEVSVDLVDISYNNGKTYLLTFQDKFTRYLDAEILSDKTAEKVTEAFCILFTKYNLTESTSLVSDNGLEFTNLLVENTLKSFGIYHSTISPYNSRANFIERTHREIRDILLALNANALNYKFKIRIGLNFYNSRPQKSLEYVSPTQMLMGIQNTNLLSHLQAPKELENGECKLADKTNKWLEYIQDMRTELAIKNAKIYSCQIENEPQFEVGELVMLVNNTLRLSKLKNNRTLGIFLVTKRNLNNYHCRNIITNVTFVRNGRNMRKLHLDPIVAEKLKSKNFKLREGHFLAPFDPDVAASSGTEFELIIDSIDEKSSFEKYNLRERK